MKLTRHRRAEVLTVKEKQRLDKAEAERGRSQDFLGRSVEIGSLRKENLEELIRDGLIRVPMRDQSEPLEDFLWRVHARDSQELEEANRRAQQLERVEENGGWFRVETMRAGLGDSPEIKDLLSYLSNAVNHFGSAHKRTTKGKLVHALLAWERGWHVSWQSGWLQRELED